MKKTPTRPPTVSPRSAARLAAALGAATLFLPMANASAGTVVGSGHVISESRGVSGFHGVEVSGAAEATITQGDSEGLVVEAEDNLLPLIESTVGGDGILRLGFKPHTGRIESKETVVFKLSARALDRLVLSGSGTIHAPSLTADKARLEVPGSGEITVDRVQTGDVTLVLAGSGKVKLAGKSGRQTIEVDGSGDYLGTGLETDDAKVEINGSGAVELRAARTLAVEINGSGSVRYHGNPAVRKQVNGSGAVEAAHEKGN